MPPNLAIPEYVLDDDGSAVTTGASDSVVWHGGKGTVRLLGTPGSAAAVNLQKARIGQADWQTLADIIDQADYTIDLPDECLLRFSIDSASSTSVTAVIHPGIPTRFDYNFPAVNLTTDTAGLVGVIHANTLSAGLRFLDIGTIGKLPTHPNLLLEVIRNAGVNPGGTAVSEQLVNPLDATAADVEVYRGDGATDVTPYAANTALIRRRFHMQPGLSWQRYNFDSPVIKPGDALAIWLTSPELSLNGVEVSARVEQYRSGA